MWLLLLYNFNASCKFPEPNTYFGKHFFLASSSTHPCNFLGNSMEVVWHCLLLRCNFNFPACLGFPHCHPFKFHPDATCLAFLRPTVGQLSTVTCRRFSKERRVTEILNVSICLIKGLTYFVIYYLIKYSIFD